MKNAGFSESGQLNVAVAGLGWWGKTIIGVLKNSAKLRVAKAVDPLPAAGEWAKSEGLEFTNDLNVALADPQIGGVVLCTPHSMHTQQIIAAANAKKHVFCEKPLTMTRRDAVEAVAACEKNGVALAVGHEHRFKPVLQDVLRMVRSGELGTIQTTEATLTHELRPLAPDNWRLQRSEAPGGTSMTALAVHALDLCIAVNGPADKVVANMRSLATADNNETLAIMINFKSGANAVITSMFGPPFSIRFAVFGNKGWAEIHDKSHPAAPEGWLLTTCKHGSKQQTVEYPGMSIVLANLEAFADAAAGRAAYPVTHEEMINNIAAFEAICNAAHSGQMVSVEGGRAAAGH
jgi:predicted dehydrogenase